MSADLLNGTSCGPEPLRDSILRHVRYTLARPNGGLVAREMFKPVSLAIRDLMTDRLLETEQRRLTEELGAAVQRYETALRGSNVTVFTQDRDLTYTSMSGPMLGRQVDEIVGKTDSEILPFNETRGGSSVTTSMYCTRLGGAVDERDVQGILGMAIGIAATVNYGTYISDVIQMVGGIAKIPGADPEQIDHILEIALDGLRYRG